MVLFPYRHGSAALFSPSENISVTRKLDLLRNRAYDLMRKRAGMCDNEREIEREREREREREMDDDESTTINNGGGDDNDDVNNG